MWFQTKFFLMMMIRVSHFSNIVKNDVSIRYSFKNRFKGTSERCGSIYSALTTLFLVKYLFIEGSFEYVSFTLEKILL